jgi:dynein heavy chain, axonemal
VTHYTGDFLFDTFQPFFFYKDIVVTYNLPKYVFPLSPILRIRFLTQNNRDGPLENYVEMIESLPHVNTPDVFGLHPNAEIGYYTNSSKEMWSNLILLQPNVSDTAGGARR